MTRFIHDQFAKEYLKELLAPFGATESGRELVSEVRQIDVLFVPASPIAPDVSELGWLGKMAATPLVLEPFRNPVQANEIRSCLNKLLDFHAALERQANREKTKITEADLPVLWILSPTLSAQTLEEFRAWEDLENWTEGIYFMGAGLKTAIAVIHQLPRTPETLWLRLLGRSNVQKQAISELKALPKDNRFRENVLELLYSLLAVLEAKPDLDTEEEELIVELSTLYLQKLEEATQKGVQQGIERGLQQGVQQGIEQGIERGERLMVESMLQVKFGVIDEELSQIIEPLIQLSPLERTQLIMQLSREELLARWQQPR